MEDPRPKADQIEVNKKLYTIKGYLQGSKSFSYRCAYHYTFTCKYLLTIPINETNYHPETLEFRAASGSYRASKEDHSRKCNDYYKKGGANQGPTSSITNPVEVYQLCEWSSDVAVLRDYIRAHISAIPSTIMIEMKKMKQSFTITQIKKN